MIISATIHNRRDTNDIIVQTDSNRKTVNIPGKAEGFGSSINGGELLLLALATCFCNDIYREGARKNMVIQSVDVTVTGTFAREHESATDITYQVNVQAPAHSSQEINDLIRFVDSIAEIHNTLRKGAQVTLKL
ncbi:OsmC family protein [Chryseolinea soli]|uniref:OsmC family peroxiredoxin n=1 Tax=Chryseolinea soli TaxID=2321403 RepID=A0A385SZ48_9BACT|nr:OsmC family protein [Chryseolinea soli]AYB35397.1 OsmC family peroxiredoxin [Chryseolinea soli]